MTGIKGNVVSSHWIFARSTPIEKTPLLSSILNDRFPDITFDFCRLSETLKKSSSGLICDLKRLGNGQLSLIDRILRRHRANRSILILSPRSYQLLRARRRKILEQCLVIISEMKSLDYLAQLPRLIEELSMRQRLHIEQEELRQMLERRHPPRVSFADFTPLASAVSTKDLVGKMISRRLDDEEPTHRGIRVSVKNWNKLCQHVGRIGEEEVLSLVSRLISRAVRGSDRVLRTKEDEFVIFFDNINSTQLKHCVSRVSSSLKEVSLVSNERPITIQFGLRVVSELPFNA